MGENSTKYVNLGNNVFSRESSQGSDDFLILDTFLQMRHENFRSTFSFVATWYKVTNHLTKILHFNSYQAIVVCGTQEVHVEKRCFIIFDFFEINFTSDFASADFQSGIYMGILGKSNILSCINYSIFSFHASFFLQSRRSVCLNLTNFN